MTIRYSRKFVAGDLNSHVTTEQRGAVSTSENYADIHPK
jgi:hypothetical protein